MAEFLADDAAWLVSLARTYPAGPQRARLVGIAGGIEDALGDARGSEIARITIVKVFNDDAEGGESVATTYSEGLSLLDALGMLAFSTWTTPATYTGQDDE